MTDLELQQMRKERWRLDGKPIQTIEDARAFLEDVGFCLMYPQRPALLVPTFIGAYVGGENRLPEWRHAFKDSRAAAATDLMVRLLRERSGFEANLFEEENGFLIAASVFPYFYAMVGERNPKLPPKAGARSLYSQLACDAYEVIQRDGAFPSRNCSRDSAEEPPLRHSTRPCPNCGQSCASRGSITKQPKDQYGTCFTAGSRMRSKRALDYPYLRLSRH